MDEDTQSCNITRSVEEFTTNFHKSLAIKTAGNFVSSALSAHVVLAMTACGAEGNTALEIQRALNLTSFNSCNDPKLHLGFQYFIDTLNNVTDVILKVANKIYASKEISIKDNFKEITGTHFRSESETIDFKNSALAAKSINQWCAEKTNDKIKKIIEPNDIDDSTRLVLLNAIYFKGSWKHRFDSCLTEDRPFYTSKTDVKNVPTMYIEKKFYYKYFEELNADCVALPYENEDMYMLIVVPKEIDGLREVERNLEKIEIQYEELSYASEKVQLYLPKFKVETTIDLNPHLNELGMSEMFTHKANFNGISDEPLKVDKVIQKAFIEVNEEGSEAAAVTGIRLVKRSLPLPPFELQVDRPFLYRILLGQHRVTLFSGRVTDPSV